MYAALPLKIVAFNLYIPCAQISVFLYQFSPSACLLKIEGLNIVVQFSRKKYLHRRIKKVL
jgi:hypothetical protein